MKDYKISDGMMTGSPEGGFTLNKSSNLESLIRNP